MEFGKVKIGCKFSFYKNSKPVYVKTSDRNDHFEDWRPFKDDPVARLFMWEDCCWRKMKDGWMFLWQPPGNQYSKGFYCLQSPKCHWQQRILGFYFLNWNSSRIF